MPDDPADHVSQPENGVVLPTLAAVAFELGVSERTVGTWKAAGCPGFQKGAHRLREIITWARANPWKTLQSSREARAAAELERIRVQTQRDKLRLMKEAGEVVNRKAAKAALSQACNMVRAKLETLPEDVSATCPNEMRADVLRQIRHVVEQALRELSQMTTQAVNHESDE
jgi:hypothetical protein